MNYDIAVDDLQSVLNQLKAEDSRQPIKTAQKFQYGKYHRYEEVCAKSIFHE